MDPLDLMWHNRPYFTPEEEAKLEVEWARKHAKEGPAWKRVQARMSPEQREEIRQHQMTLDHERRGAPDD